MSKIKECQDCPYRWQNEDEDFPTCHFIYTFPDDKAPCEQTSWDDPEGWE